MRISLNMPQMRQTASTRLSRDLQDEHRRGIELGSVSIAVAYKPDTSKVNSTYRSDDCLVRSVVSQ